MCLIFFVICHLEEMEWHRQTCLALHMINLLLIITVPINYIMHNIICSVCAVSDLLFIMMMWVGHGLG